MTTISLSEFKALVMTQASILRIYRDLALEALPDLVPSEAKRKELRARSGLGSCYRTNYRG